MAEEGLQYDVATGEFKLGNATNGTAPIVSSRFVRVGTGGTLTFNTGASKMLELNNDGSVNISTTGTTTTTIGNTGTTLDVNANGMTVDATTLTMTAPTMSSTSTTSNTINALSLTLNNTSGNATTIGNTNGTFELISDELNVATSGDISDDGGNVVIADNLDVTGTGTNNIGVATSTNTILGTTTITGTTSINATGTSSTTIGNTTGTVSITGTTTMKSASELRFEDNDGLAHYSSFKAGAQTANLQYTLPTSAPTATNNVLKATTTANPLTLAWSNPNSAVVYDVDSPTQWTGNQDNVPVPSDATVMRVSSSGDIDLNGLSPTGATMGRIVVLVNAGTNAITLKDNNSGTVNAGFILPGDADVVLDDDGSVTLMYDSNTGGWRVLSVN
jgi:hypothetical protein